MIEASFCSHEILLYRHDLEPESWQTGTMQTSHASCHSESLSDMPDLDISELHLSLCGLVDAAQFSVTSCPVLFKPGGICSAVTVFLLIMLCSQLFLILSRDCHKQLLALSSLSFSLQTQVILQQKNVPPQFEDQHLVIKGVTKQLPRPQFSSLSLISKAFKHMFTCRLIISHGLSRAMLFCLLFMDP